ncbi:MAG: choice-of-anchor Q domain-containing protein [Acidimicrobiia bacterium]
MPPRNREERRAARRLATKRAGAGAAALTASTAAFATALIGGGVVPASGVSQTFTVSSTADNGANTLRQAVLDANANAGADTIVFTGAAATPGAIITLTTGQIKILDSVDIQGPGATVLAVDGNDNDRIFYLYDPTAGTIDVTISGLTLTNGNVDAEGGAIINLSEHLTILDSVLSANEATGGGGAIATEEAGNTLAVIDSVITGNVAGGEGGGLYALYSDSVTILRTEISGNDTDSDGGGIDADGIVGTFTISDSTITGNDALGGQGGALYTDDFVGDLIITNTTIAGNTATQGGGGLALFDHDGSVSVVNSVISGNSTPADGGGVQIDDLYTGQAFQVVNTTIAGNHATDGGGGGIWAQSFDGAFLMRNSTVSGNTATFLGGGLYLGGMYGSAQILNSTVSGNTSDGAGGAIALLGYYGLSVVQSTITGNTGARVGGIYASGSGTDAQSASDHSGVHDGDADDSKVHAQQALGEVGAVGTILAGNSGYDIGPGVTVTSFFSLLGTTANTATIVDTGGTLTGVNPLVAPLANNGGPTQTHALLDGSPAINTGPLPPAVFPGSEFDQRGPGFDRVMPAGGRIDIGAYEVQLVVILPAFTG